MFEIFQLHICFLVVELPIVYLKTKNVVFVVKNNNVLFCSNIWRENHVMDRTLVSLNAPELGCAVGNYVTWSRVESPIPPKRLLIPTILTLFWTLFSEVSYRKF